MYLFKSILVAAAVSVLCGTATLSAVELPPNDYDGPPISFFANLSADEESAVTESPGTGRVDFVLERKPMRVSWKGTYSELTSEALGIHVHGPQTPGGEAGIMFDLAPNGIKNSFEGSTVINDGQLEYLLTSRFYVNLHTTKYKAGELRGTVRRLPPKAPIGSQVTQ